jgi:N-acetylmuramoyl-L-alanine amidase
MTHSHFHIIFFFLAMLLLPPAAKSDPSGNAIAWKSLSTVQTAFGVTNFAWDGDSLCFSNEQHLVRFFQGRRKTDVNGTMLWLNAPPDGSVTGGNWRIAATDLDLLLLSVLPKEEGTLKPMRVMLDPGHGGEDDGSSSKKPHVKEKDLTLAVALKLGARLSAAGLQVLYTRTNDVTLALDERSILARRNKADLFVSIHANYAPKSDASGVETYVLTPCGYSGTAEGSRVPGWQIGNRNDFHNTLLGFSIHSRLASIAEAPDRGLKRQSFSVLRETSCPAVLVEIGFLSNHSEAVKMTDAAWQEKCAATIGEGILTYAKKVDGLDKAVAAKRARDAEASERWRLRLAAQAAKPFGTLSTNKGTRVQSGIAIIAALPTNKAAVVRMELAAASITNTNTAPVVLSNLFEFYETGRTE